MKRAAKVEAVESLRGELARARVAVLADNRGLTALQMNRVRRAVREAEGRCRVSKNRLARRAIAGGRYQAMEGLLRGPTTVILGFADPVAIAKVAVKLSEEFPKLEIKGAVLDGQMVEAAGVKALAALPPREVLLAQLLGVLQAPATQLVRTVSEPAARLARLVDALARRAEGGGS